MTSGGGATNLTQAQTLIWAGQQLHPADPLYNMVHAFRIGGPVDPDRFHQAFRLLVEGTDSLRTVFADESGRPHRLVVDGMPSSLGFVDLSAEADPSAAYRSWVELESRRMLDLTACLYRSSLVKLAEDDWVWFLVQHHLITDGWATAIVYQRMEEIYRALNESEPPPDDFPAFDFYAEFEAGFRRSDESTESAEYWKRRSEDDIPIVSFYGETPEPGGLTRTDRITASLGAERSSRIAALVASVSGGGVLGGISHFTTFATAMFAWLHRISGERALGILAPAHNRPSRRFKSTAGLFMEVLPLHVEIDERETFRSLMEKVAERAGELLLHARPGTSSATHNRAYSVLLNVINAQFTAFNGWPMESEWVHPGHGDSDHSLRLQIHDFDGTGDVQLHFDLSAEVFDRAAEQRIVRHFLAIVDAMLTDLDQEIGRVSLLTEEERSAAASFRGPDVSAPYASVLEAFGDVVTTTPDAVAVVDDDRTLTYAELDAVSERIGEAVRSAATQSEPVVAVYLPRSAELIAALLGVFKAGGAYVPIDSGYPSERVALLVRDSGAAAVVTTVELAERLSGTGVPLVMLPLGDPAGARPALPGAGETAYLMYTSGSTGTPKGVVVTHDNLVDYVWWARTTHGGEQPVSFPLYSSVGFDLTVTSLFVPLVSGGSVVVYREPAEGADLAIIDVFADDAVDVVKLTPAHLALLGGEALRTTRIRTLILGGEDLKTSLAAAVHRSSEGRLAIYNEYGPTEATVGCMLHRFDPERDTAGSVPIGRPAPNTGILLLDANGEPVPVGVVGEMWVSGAGVAAGYHGRPDLTEERFRPHPTHPGERMYGTGDLARWSAPGVIEFLGRADDQVKVKGHRIELGEVDSHVRDLSGVSDAVVTVVETETARVGSAVSAEQCVRCGLSAAHPEAKLDTELICGPCRFYEEYRTTADAYFGTMDEFREIFAGETSNGAEPDCLMLLSGGKDSTYALYQLVEHGLTPLVFSLDNGFISDGAKANIERAVADLGLELVWGSTPAMNDIFADSLGTFSNVCQGCFKTIYTLATSLARQRGIRFMVTGLSRGQIFETRLADLFRIGITDPDEIDRAVIEARKAYHRVDDAVRRLMDTTVFDDAAVFDDIRIVDFYRYCDVGLAELYRFLDEKAPWVRPKDTGRSTNCLINNTGIFVHKRERGFHNYALPYSWDVRLGHKTKTAALAELDDEIDVIEVRGILDEVGYEVDAEGDDGLRSVEKRLVAYYVTDHGLDPAALRDALAERVPDFMVPTYLIPMDAIPLTINGKVDREALPDPRRAVRSSEAYVAPRNDVERSLVDIWQSVLGVDTIGIHDPFVEIGGDSILNIQVVAKARANGLHFTAQQLFDRATIARLAPIVEVGQQIAESPLETPAFAESGLGADELDALLEAFGEDGE